MDTKKTPYYRIDTEKFIDNCKCIENAFYDKWNTQNVIFGYSIKTNRCPQLLKTAKDRNWKAEVVSYDEYLYAADKGFGESQMICNGPVKGKMLGSALNSSQIVNLDNLDEVEEICSIMQYNKTNCLIGLRVNFNLEEVCPGETTIGSAITRFGINYENGDLEKAVRLLRLRGVHIDGLHMHMSTKTRSLNVFKQLALKACEIINRFNLDVKFIDMGGGYFGGQTVVGKPTMEEYADVICSELKKCCNPDVVKLILEPGASVLATAVDYVTTVANVRDVAGEKIVTVDGTNLHINPFMVNRMPVFSVTGCGEKIVPVQHICGCTCLENDRFFTIYDSSELIKGSKIVFSNVGAYTMTFNSKFIIDVPKSYL